MNTVTVHKAAPVFEDSPVASTTIEIMSEQPVYPSDTYVQDAKALFSADAHALYDALKSALPGGTLDHLFAVMADDRASILRVPNPHAYA